MMPAQERLAADLGRPALRDPARARSSTTWTRASVRGADECRDGLVRQVSAPVRWQECGGGAGARGGRRPSSRSGRARCSPGLVKKIAQGRARPERRGPGVARGHARPRCRGAGEGGMSAGRARSRWSRAPRAASAAPSRGAGRRRGHRRPRRARRGEAGARRCARSRPPGGRRLPPCRSTWPTRASVEAAFDAHPEGRTAASTTSSTTPASPATTSCCA